MKNIIPFLAFAMIIILIGCYKREGELIPYNPGTDGLQLQDNAYVLDTTTFELVSSMDDLADGRYRFTVKGSPPLIQAGDVIVGEAGVGFLRKVVTVTESNGEITFETAPADLEDLFMEGNFQVDLDLSSSQQYKTLDLQYDIFNLKLYDEKHISIAANGSIAFETDLNMDFSFEDGDLQRFRFNTENAQITSSLRLQMAAEGAVELLNEVDTLAGFKKRIVFYLPVSFIQVPVVVEITTDFLLKYAASLDANIQTSVTYSVDNKMDLGLTYENDEWNPISDIQSPETSLKVEPPNGQGEVKVDLELVPVLTARVYGLTGPFISTGLKEQIIGRVASPELDWDLSVACWLETTIGLEASVFENTLLEDLKDFKKSWRTDAITYHTPYELRKVSGDNQTGPADAMLVDPVVVQVLDEFGYPQSNVPVYFEITSGDGKVVEESILTDMEGMASNFWTLGSDEKEMQTLEVSARNADGEEIMSSPVILTASATEKEPNAWEGKWKVFAHSLINCPDPTENRVLNADSDGNFCFQDENPNDGTIMESCTFYYFTFTATQMIYEVFDSGILYDTEIYQYSLLGPNTVKICYTDEDGEYCVQIDFVRNGYEMNMVLTVLSEPDCQEEFLLRLQ